MRLQTDSKRIALGIARLLTKASAAGVLAAALALPALLVTAPAPVAAASTTPARLTALRWAETQAGHPYVFGGTGPGFDCSGLVMESYAHAGITIPRTTYAMAAAIGDGHLRIVPASQRERGDIAFYGTGHVELVTLRGTFGALEPGTVLGWHHPSGSWRPTLYVRVTR
jgi:cell wall-associated NlpC family hydrolase